MLRSSLARFAPAVLLLLATGVVPAVADPPLAGIEGNDSTDSAATRMETQTVVVRHLRPTVLLGSLLPVVTTTGSTFTSPHSDGAATFSLLSGIEAVSMDDVRGEITIRGDKAARDRFVGLVQLLDVEPRRTRLRLRVLRGTADGKTDTSFASQNVVATAVLESANNAPQQVTLLGDGLLFAVQITPHINGDNSVTAATRLSVAPSGKAESRSYTVQSTLRMKTQPQEIKVFVAPVSGATGLVRLFRLEVTPFVEGVIAAPIVSLPVR